MNTTIAKLTSGKLINYDACDDHRIVPMYWKAFRYIGKGTIFSINEVKQSGEKIYHFWVYKDKYKHLRSGLPYDLILPY